MTSDFAHKLYSIPYNLYIRSCLALIGCIFVLASAIYAQITPVKDTVIIDDARDGELIIYGRNVVVKSQVKGVLTFGGDIIVEGRIEENVATVGGSVYQKEGAFIGGDVIILGGKYVSDSKEPLRNPGKETIMFAGYEDELRNLVQNPISIFKPEFSWMFLALRIISALFWFAISFATATVAPAALSNAIGRFRFSPLKILAIGFASLWIVTLGVMALTTFLPNELSVIVGLMAIFLVLLALTFGRVAMQLSVGKWLQKRIFPGRAGSESIALLFGTLFWTILLSVPYLWTLAVIFLFAVGLGLVFTARSGAGWRSSAVKAG